jgi:hypothetical protein
VKFARIVFGVAGVYGLLNLLPQYLLEERIGIEAPPAITHPEYYYGFVGVAVAFQLAFLLIARDPVRFRPMMLPSIVEKLAFGIAVPILYVGGRVSSFVFAFALVDLAFAALFLVAYRRTAGAASQPGG